MTKKVDYYEFLQISPNAEDETIHRVYRFLAARFHPDNPDSGNAEKFATLTAAYEVLSNPARRAKYDAARGKELADCVPLSNTVDFMDTLEGELNRRLAVLAVLYFRRRSNPVYPEVSLGEIETQMGFPRDYLDFTTWYLQKKGYITKADNSDFTLTVDGVDFVETQRVNIPVLNKLLTPGEPEEDTKQASNGHAPRAVIVLPDMTQVEDRRERGDRRVNLVDRRAGNPDLRENRVERRTNGSDRRRNGAERRSKNSQLQTGRQPITNSQ